MSYYQTTTFNPYLQYSMYPMYNWGYNQPMFMGLPNNTALPLVQQQAQQTQINITNLDSISFSANKQIQQQTKEGLSTGAKWAIGIGATTALAVGADFLFCKGKHVKSLLGKSGKSNGSKGGNGSSVGGNTSSTNKPSGTSKPPKSPITPSNTGSGTTNTNSSSVSGGTSSPNTSSTSKTQTKPSSSNTTTNNKAPTNSTNKQPPKTVSELAAYLDPNYSSPRSVFHRTMNSNYFKLRICNPDYYVMNKSYNPQVIEDITSKATKDIVVREKAGWNYRCATKNLKPGQKSPKTVDRISLNVYPDENLIKELDDFIARCRVNVEYKTPELFGDWTIRHDPITMYFRENIPQDVKDELIKIVTPYVRIPKAKGDIMIGTKLAKGIYQVKEPTGQDILNLIKRAEKLGDKELNEYLRTSPNLFDCPNGIVDPNKPKTSVGMFRAAEMLIEDLERFKSGIV